MAAYNIEITEAGIDLIQKQIIAGTEPLKFSAIAIGDGRLADGVDVSKMQGLINERKRLPVETFVRVGSKLWVTARLSTDSITESIYHREVGVFVGDTLFAYGNAGENYDFIPPAGENAAVSKIIRMTFAIGSAKVLFDTLDTTDLVTFDALEMRIETIVKPVAREVLQEVADNVAPEAVNRAVDKYMDEAVGLLVNRRVNEELYAPGEYRTMPGADNYMGYAFDLFEPPLGDMSQIALPCRSKAGDMYTDLPVYLAVFEETATGEWVHVGTSTNAITQTISTTAYFNFDSLHLSGRPVRLMIKTSREDTEPVAHYNIGARVTPAPEKGVAWTNVELTASMEYVIDVTFTGANVEEKYAPRTIMDAPINAYQLFKGDELSALPENMNLSRVLFANEMFMDCQNLGSITGLKMPCAMETKRAFAGCVSLTDITESDFGTSKNCSYMFSGCSSLRNIGNPNFDAAENCNSMFENCTSLTDVGYTNFSSLKTAINMFKGCTSLMDAASLNYQDLTDAYGMFAGCKLNEVTVQLIADSINTVQSGAITIGIHSSNQNDTISALLDAIRAKGWTVYVEYNS